MIKERKPKVLVVGLDGGTFDLVKPWVEQQKLPTFAYLMKDGFSHDLTSELPPGTVPNWPTFMTGKNAGKHGIIHWLKRKRGSTSFSVVDSRNLRGQTIWDILSKRGKRSIVINVPVTFPPHEINGLMITDLLTPPSAKVYTYPPDLRSEIEALGYMLFPDKVCVSGGEGNYLKALGCVSDARLRTSLHLMQRYDWDFFMVVFSCTDHVGHYFWKFSDPKHPQYVPNAPQEYKDAILNVYQDMDQALRSFIDAIDEDTTLIVMSDHGFGPLYQKSHSNNWLIEAGALQLKTNILSRLKWWLFQNGFTPQNIYKVADRIGITKYRKRVDPKRRGNNSLFRRIFLSLRDIDWSETKACAFGGMGQIYINLKGRDPFGIVEPGEEYQRLRDELAAGLYKIINPLWGQPYVKKVYMREEIYSGENLDSLPDIVFEPYDLSCVDSGDFEFFSNKLFDGSVGISGAHRSNGMIIMWGNKVVVHNANQQSALVKMVDLAPTILYLLGEPIPDGMDGRVISEAISNEYLQVQPPQRSKDDSTIAPNDSLDGFTQQEEEELISRLTDLGYLS